MQWQNKITELLGVQYPIVQAPMLGVASPEMVVAAAEAGCLGSLPLGDLSATICLEKIRKAKQLTDKPFAVNIFLHEIPKTTPLLEMQYVEARKSLELFAIENDISVDIPIFAAANSNNTQEQLQVVLDEKIPILSFTFGNLDAESITLLKNNNVTLIGTCTSLEEAISLENAGIDAICVQGIEAGGHRGSFLTNDDHFPKIGGFSLLTTIVEKTRTPIIYAGGIYNRKTILAAQTLGAQGFQIGSMLLCSEESELKPFEKERLLHVKQTEIVLTKSFTGKYARGINNEFMRHFENVASILPYPYQNMLTRNFRNAARAKQNAELVNIWAGQSVHNYSFASTKTILSELIGKDANTII